MPEARKSDKPAKANTKKQREQARMKALGGDVETAIKLFGGLVDAGDNSAAASLAELFAFQGRWADVIPNAARLLANRDCVYADNVFQDMLRLIGRAGHETRRWPEIERAAKTAAAAEKASSSDPDVRKRHLKLFTNLGKYAQRGGKPPHELVHIFKDTFTMPKCSAQENLRGYENAVKNPPGHVKKAPPLRVAQHHFALAVNYEQDDTALSLFEKFGTKMGWDKSVHVARILIGRKQTQKAWAILEPALPTWIPVDLAQVAPLELLIDEKLNSLMTKERCAHVLSVPRGM